MMSSFEPYGTWEVNWLRKRNCHFMSSAEVYILNVKGYLTGCCLHGVQSCFLSFLNRPITFLLCVRLFCCLCILQFSSGEVEDLVLRYSTAKL